MGRREPTLIAERFKTAMELFEVAEAMLRQKLRRKYPLASEAEIEAHMQEWLEWRPGAEQGDGVGRPVAWPRRP
jgi:Rv0078B-related antitoxin